METKTIFTIPADFKVDSIAKFSELNKKADVKLGETYGSIKSYEIGTGRKYSLLPDVNKQQLKEYVKFCKENNIDFNYTLNLSCAGNKEFTKEGVNELTKGIDELVSMGINNFTIALPGLIELFNEKYPNVDVTLSVITGVDSIGKMKEFCKYKNIKVIYLHERIYRRMDLMKKLIEIAHKNGKKVGMIINSFCLADCMYRQYHYDLAAHSTDQTIYLIPDYYRAKCALAKITDKRTALMCPWVRPEDMQRYIDIGIDKFKVTGREMLKGGDMFKVFEVYNSRTYDGNLVDLFMCFDDCVHANVIKIKNDKNLADYLDDVYTGKNVCNVNGCIDCMKCKKALDSIEFDKEQQKKWKGIFEKQISNFRKELNN